MLALILSLAVTAHADVSNFNIVKSQDGKILNCASNDDIGRAGYRPLITTMQADGDALKLDTAVANVKCVLKDGHLQFDMRLPSDPVPGHDLDGNPTTEYLAQQKFLVTDRGDNVLGLVAGQNMTMQPLTYRFPVASSFSREDLARLARGETLSVQWEWFMQGTSTVRSGNETIPLGLFTGGSYNLTFKLSRSAGRYLVSDVRLQ